MKLINGYTKESFVAKVKEKNNGTRAMDNGSCMYMADDGNRCFIGAFIPDGHPALTSTLSALDLIQEYLDLKKHMPFESNTDLRNFQRMHDDTAYPYNALEDFVKENLD